MKNVVYSIGILISLFCSCSKDEMEKLSGDLCTACSGNPNHEFGGATVFIPTLLTPNGDGYNDHLRIYGLEEFPDNSLTIYDRNKNEIATFSPYANEWNGHYNNKTYGNGLYFYQLTSGSITTEGAFISLGVKDDYYNIKVSMSRCSMNCSVIDPSDPFID